MIKGSYFTLLPYSTIPRKILIYGKHDSLSCPGWAIYVYYKLGGGGGGAFGPIPSFHDIKQPAYKITNNKSVSGELEG